MTAKEYVKQIRKIDNLIANKMAEMDRWKSAATSSTVPTDGERVQSSGNKEKMAYAVCKYLTIDEEINAAIDKLVDTKVEVISTLEQLDAMDYDILHKIYVQYLDFVAIADLMHKSYTWVTTIHGRALANLQKILDERESNAKSKETEEE